MDSEYCTVTEVPVEKASVPSYTPEQHGTWELLIGTQNKLVHGRACDSFIKGLENIAFPQDRIPLLRDVSKVIEGHTGWKLIRVDGLVHPVDFFSLLSRRIFPSTDFIRERSELMYTPAPDMFHDLFGHAPLLSDKRFTEFFEEFGSIGVLASKKYPQDHEIHKMLPRLYWFTVEFGLKNTPNGLRAFGSGSVSSPEEIQFCVGPKCRHHDFDIDVVSKRDYDIWHLQEDVFVINSFDDLRRDFASWSRRQGL